MLETATSINTQTYNLKNYTKTKKKKYTTKNNQKNKFLNYLLDIDTTDKYFSLNYKDNLFVARIPNKVKYFISTIRYETTMNNLFGKISDFGLAFQGFFNIELITTLPSLYQTKKNNTPNDSNETAFLVIDNHTNLKIMNYNDILCYEPMGVNVQYVEGIKLYENGISYLDSIHFDHIDVMTENECCNAFLKISCAHLLLANDHEDNMYIVYHPNINLTDINNLLGNINCKDAILLCSSGKINIMWKYANRSKNSNYIGNQNEIISDIIVLST